MANRISIDDLAKTIESEVRNWTKDVVDDIDGIKKDITKMVLNNLE